MTKRMTLLAIVGIVFGFLTEGRAAQPQMGGTLTFGLGKAPANPNPFIATSSTTQFVKETCYESLLTRDYEERIVPSLADSYEVSAGGSAITLRLRKGVKFHNGKEMKADDVVWSAHHVMEPKNGAFGQNLTKDVASVDILDEHTVRFTLSRPSATFLSYLSNIRMLPIVPARSLQPGQIKLESNTFVPGTGPFLFEKVQPGFDTTVRRFPEYWGTPAYLDRIVFRPISNTPSRFNALRAGDVQMADRLAPLDVDRVKKGIVKGLTVVEEPLGGFQHLIVNHLSPLLRKVEMRQALSYAIDKQRLVDEVFFGAATATDTMMSPKGIWAKAADLPPHKRDLGKARALLKIAGYSGQELLFIGRSGETEFSESLQRILGEAGIKIKLEHVEGGVMAERVLAGKYDLHIGGGTVSADPVVTMVPEYYTAKTEKGRYSNPKVDQLFDSLSSEFEEQKRLKIFRDLAWTLHNEVASIPLLFEARYVGMSEKVQGYGPPKGYIYISTGNYFKHVWLK